jgi:outer membrane immunogenic protein
LNSTSALGGGQAGYNWQTGAFVWGVETDIDALRLSASANGLQPLPATPLDQVNLSQTLNWLGTTRGRVGVAFGNGLLYGTGGVAYGSLTDSYTEFVVGTPAETRMLSESTTRVGWVVGAGYEYAVGKNLSFGIEYLHVDLGSLTVINPTSTVGGLLFPTSQASFTDRSDIVRAKLNWRFDWAPAPSGCCVTK